MNAYVKKHKFKFLYCEQYNTNIYIQTAFYSLLEDTVGCLFENSANYSTLLHKSPKSGEWHAYADIEISNLDCIDDIDIDYDDYCISSFTYEAIFSLISTSGSCVYGSPYLTLDSDPIRIWNLDQIDGTTDNLYNHYEYSSVDSGIDVYILDTGIRSSHQEFDGLNVGNHDWYVLTLFCFFFLLFLFCCILYFNFFFFIVGTLFDFDRLAEIVVCFFGHDHDSDVGV